MTGAVLQNRDGTNPHCFADLPVHHLIDPALVQLNVRCLPRHADKRIKSAGRLRSASTTLVRAIRKVVDGGPMWPGLTRPFARHDVEDSPLQEHTGRLNKSSLSELCLAVARQPASIYQSHRCTIAHRTLAAYLWLAGRSVLRHADLYRELRSSTRQNSWYVERSGSLASCGLGSAERVRILVQPAASKAGELGRSRLALPRGWHQDTR